MSTTDKVLRSIVLAGVFAIPLIIPFIVSSTMFFPFITGKNFTFRIIAEIIFAAWFILALSNKAYRPKYSWVAAAVGVFIVVLFTADVLAENPHKAFWSNYERMEGFVSLFHLALYFVVAGSALLTERLWNWFWHTPLAVSIAMFFYGILQLRGELVINQGGVRLDGTLGNATYLAGFLVFNIFIALIFWARKHMDRLELILGSWVVGSGIFVFYHVYPFIKKTIEVAKSGVNTDVSFFYGKYSELLFFVALAIIGVGTWLYYSSRRWQLASRQKLANFLYPLTAIILFYPLYNTATRGAMIGLLGGLLLSALIIIIWGKETPKLRKTAILIAFFLVVVSGALWLARDTNVIRENATLSRLTSINWNDADANARKMVWNMAWQGVKERPILGWGQEGFNYVFNKYYDPGMYLREQWFDRTHNIIFDWLIAGGILGLLSYLSLLIFAALYIADWAPKFIKSKMSEPAHRFTTLEKALFVGFLAAYFFQVFFVFDNVVSYIVLFAFLAYLHSRSAVQIEAIEKAESVTDADAARFYAPIMLVLLAASIWFVNGRSITASRDLIRALNRQPEPMANYDYFKKAIADGGFANQEIREQIVQAAANVAAVSDQQVSPTIKSAFVALAQSELEKQIEESPKDARIHVFAGSFYSIINNVQAAISELEKALTLSPNKQVIKATLANIYLREGTVNHNAEYVKKSATLMKSAFESAPQFTDVRNGYIVASIYAGDLKSANSVIDKYQDDAPIDQHVTQALVDAGQSERALAVAKNSYSKFPNDPNAAVTLASVYVQLGAKTTAISILKEAAGKIPSYKDKLTELATQIQNSK